MKKRDAYHEYLKIALIAAVMAAALLLCACTDKSEQITSLDQLNEKGTVIAVSTSTPEANTLPDDFPNAIIESCTDIFPAYQEVSTGRITAVMYQRPEM